MTTTPPPGVEALMRACHHVGSQSELARVLSDIAKRKLNQQNISYWMRVGVPVEWCGPLERAAPGVVSRRELRPGDWAMHWPELAQLPPLSLPPQPATAAMGIAHA